MKRTQYHFFLKKCLLPIAPSKLEVKINNANETVTLINEGEVNILKTPGLTDIDFECEILQVQYPFALYKNGFVGASYFLDYFEKLKTDKKPFRFIVTRTFPARRVKSKDEFISLFSTKIMVSLEDYTIKESAENGFDLTIKIRLKQYRDHSGKYIDFEFEEPTDPNDDTETDDSNPAPALPSSPQNAALAKKFYGRTFIYEDSGILNRPNTEPVATLHGESLWEIAKLFYNDGNLWVGIYEFNKDIGDNGGAGTLSVPDPNYIPAGKTIILPGYALALELTRQKS